MPGALKNSRLAISFGVIFALLISVLTPNAAFGAYATVTTVGSMSAREDITITQLTDLAPSWSPNKNPSFPNERGGIFYLGAPSAGSSSVKIRSYIAGGLDATFGGTGEITFTTQLTTSRNDWQFTTYNNGNNWAFIEEGNASAVGYLYTGTYTSSSVTGVMIPSTNTNTNSTCPNVSVPTGWVRRASGLDFASNLDFGSQLALVLSCWATGNSDASTTYFPSLVKLSGGTISSAGSWVSFNSTWAASEIGPARSAFTDGGHRLRTIGVSSFTGATGSQAKATFFHCVNSTQWLNNNVYDYASENVSCHTTEFKADGTRVVHANAWTPTALVGTRGGANWVPARNNGVITMVQYASDGGTGKAIAIPFTAGVAGTATTPSGSYPIDGMKMAYDQNISGTAKMYSVNSNVYVYHELNLSTGALTNGGTFTAGNGSLDASNLLWNSVSNSSGLSFYGITSSTNLVRMSVNMTPTAPSAVATPTATVGDGSVSLSWSAPSANGSPITDYVIEYSTDGTNWVTFSDGTSTATTATVTGLTNGQAYVFRISATNNVGTSTASSSSTSTTPNPVPPAASGLTVTGNGTANQAVLNWSAVTASPNAVTDYKIEYSLNGGAWTTYTDGVSTNTTATVTGLTAGGSYAFRVSAINTNGAGAPSGATTDVIAASAPSAPASAPTVTATPGSFVVAWPAASNGGSAVTDYTIQYSTNGSTWTTFTHGATSATTATITGLTASTAYVIKVSAKNWVGSSSFSSNSASTTFLPATSPATVGAVVTSPGAGGGVINLSWTAPADNGSAINDYVIQYSSDGGITWTTFADGLSASASAVVTGLVPGANYVFKVSAVNGIGTAAASTASVAQAAPQPAPSSTTTSNSDSAAPTTSPVIEAFSARSISTDGGPITFTGYNMDSVVSVLIGGIDAKILAQDAYSLEVQAPKGLIGWVDIFLLGKLGTTKFENALKYEAANQLKSTVVKRFWKANLSQRSAAALARDWVKTSSATSVVCIAHYSSKKDLKLARARALTLCNTLKAAKPSLVIRAMVSKAKFGGQAIVRFNY